MSTAGSFKIARGDRDPLPLSARELDAALTDQRRRSPWASRSMNSCACAARAAASMSRRRRAGPRIGDVLADRAAEERRLLRHDADGAPEIGQRSERMSGVIEQNAAAVDVPESR